MHAAYCANDPLDLICEWKNTKHCIFEMPRAVSWRSTGDQEVVLGEQKSSAHSGVAMPCI